MIRAWAATLGGFASMGAFVSQGSAMPRRPPRPSRAAVELGQGPYARGGVEPPLDDVLRDPIVQLLMRSDRLDARRVRAAADRTTCATSTER